MQSRIYSIPFEQYEGIPAASKHLLDALSISPLHCWSYFINPERMKGKETPAKVLGNAIHVSILEPERFEKEFVREPDKTEIQKISTKKILDLADDYKREAKALGLKVTGTKPELKKILSPYPDSFTFWDELYEELTKGKKVLSESDWRITKAITSRVRKHPAASELLKYGQAEQSIFWTDPDTGIQCKGRIDWLNDHIVDLKSTTDASPEGFQRSISKYRYYVQAAMYVDGLYYTTGKECNFVFAAWEKHSPYASALYYATPEMLEAGRQEYKRLLKIYAKCLESDVWNGYNQEIMPIDLPQGFKATSSLSEPDWLDEMEEGL
jgi:hypothetical protein